MPVGVDAGDETVEHFRTHGWMRVRGAFSVEEAAAMRAAALQRVKHHLAFRAVGSPRVLRAIDGALEGQAHETPSDWGAAFLALPTSEPWNVPSRGWHADANYLSALSPPDGVRTHALFGDVAPRAGGTLILSGSHRLIHRYFKENPPPRRARGADYRQLLQRHPYIRDLHMEGDAGKRAARFMERGEEHEGVLLQVIENAGSAGDVMLLHPLVLHVATANTSQAPRFLLSGGIDLPSMWPQFRR